MIGRVARKPVITAAPETTIQEAAHRMRRSRIGALVVVEDGKPVGLLTDRDITVSVVALGKDPATVEVGAVMRKNPVVIREDQGLLDATKLLARRGVRRLPVVDRSGKLTGIVSLDDLLMLLGSEMGHIASALASELGRAKL
jgi:CBS domain-containing protein